MGQVLDHGAPREGYPAHRGRPKGRPTAAGRAGYLIAIVVNALMALVANSILEWEIAPFLTDDFERVLPAINTVIAVTIAVNIARLFYAPKWFVAATEVMSTGFGLAATVRMYQIFPFDFDSYDFRWDLVAKTLLVVAIVGSVIGIATSLFKAVTGLLSGS